MIVSVIIATCGSVEWADLAYDRARPSALDQGAATVVTHHDEHATIEQARNDAAAFAHEASDWLCFLDADDQLAPNYLRQMRWADVCGLTPALLIPAVSYIHPDGRETRPEIPNTHQPFTVMNHAVIGTLVPRALFEQVGGFTEGLGLWEDWELWLKCIRAGAELVYAPRAVYRAHVSDGSRNDGFTQAQKLALHRKITREHKRAMLA